MKGTNSYRRNYRIHSQVHTDKITTHPNELASTMLEEEGPRRLKSFKPTDLTTRFS
jgi:hypothetical protein